ncbi:flavin reductase (DIM6/NTAB) family NADH-FMN oxidoreductase RutF [Bradyrhizobium sp. USDA 3315]
MRRTSGRLLMDSSPRSTPENNCEPPPCPSIGRSQAGNLLPLSYPAKWSSHLITARPIANANGSTSSARNGSTRIGVQLQRQVMSHQSAPGIRDIPSVQATEFRQAMRNLAGGVAIVATGTAAERRGLTVSSVTSICMEPPCLLVGINAGSETHDGILASRSFGVSLLSTDQEDLALRFGGQGGAKGIHRFDTAPWKQGALDVPLLRNAFCALECVLYDHKVIGTHSIFIGRVIATRVGHGNPLINFRGALRTLLLD